MQSTKTQTTSRFTRFKSTMPAQALQPVSRVASIDLLRGLIMIIMALDHVRDYFHAEAFLYDPTDLSRTSIPLFFTRWITHFCAPIFMFLSGTSAFLVGERKGKKALSYFLLTRGLWLIFLELTVVNFGWFFHPGFPTLPFLVIWALGVSMIALAGLLWLPLPVIAGPSLVMIFGHNLLDPITGSGNNGQSFGWALLHQMNGFRFFGKTFFVGYPIIPWIGVMAIGYCTGVLYQREARHRKQWLLWSGLSCIAGFLLLRYSNSYGDPAPWQEQANGGYTVLSFLNVTKYPPSLLYLLMTLGPSLIFLAYTEQAQGWLSQKIATIGRVPLFYYLVHLYLIHLSALAAAQHTGFGWRSMVLEDWITNVPALAGYGFSLGTVYLLWLGLVVVLYFLCRWYDGYKRAHKHRWWLSYL